MIGITKVIVTSKENSYRRFNYSTQLSKLLWKSKCFVFHLLWKRKCLGWMAHFYISLRDFNHSFLSYFWN